MQFNTFVCGITRDIRYNFKQGHVTVQIRRTVYRAVNRERSDDLAVVNQGHANKRHLGIIMAATRAVQEAGILAQVRNHMAHTTFSHVPRNSFAHAVKASLLFGFI